MIKENFIIKKSTIYKAKVESFLSRHDVDIDQNHYTYRYWQLIRLLYIHAVTFIETKKHPL